MPNIIEQQDLLKGLPDTRLMTLLQNPVADIPPFLVAAEAQRRQALRQQFAGSENKESVVDTLTKQLANVPQNISAPPQRTPQIPPTPPMMGVAALQQQQAMQQAAQPQQMRGGGMVQRYQTGGKVEPWWTLPDVSGPITAVGDWVGSTASSAYDFLTTPYGERQPDITEEVEKPRIFPTMPPGSSAGATFKPFVPEPGKKDTSEENKTKSPEVPTPQPGETEDEFRSRLEALYRDQEPSDWEKAQKWAAMAEQFLDPSKTTMQSVAGAAKAFAEGAGEEQKAKRLMGLEREKALYEYDVSEAERKREEAEKERERARQDKSAALKAKTDVATSQIGNLYRASDQIRDDLRRTIEAIKQQQGLTDAEIAKLPEVKQKAEILQSIQERIANLQNYLDETYNMPKMGRVDTATRKIVQP